MPLEAGTLDIAGNFVHPDCLAKYIEDSLPTPGPLPADPTDPVYFNTERRKFLIGFATGIINYLKEHDGDSFVVTLTNVGSGATAELEIR